MSIIPTAIWPNDESEPSNTQTVIIDFMLYPPTNLTGPDWTWGGDVELTWDSPTVAYQQNSNELLSETTLKDFLYFNIYRSEFYDPFELIGTSTNSQLH